MPALDFTTSAALSVGVELELMLVNTRDFNLAPDADDLLRRATREAPGGELKPEITQSMVEINTSVHERYPELLAELHGTRDALPRAGEGEPGARDGPVDLRERCPPSTSRHPLRCPSASSSS